MKGVRRKKFSEAVKADAARLIKSTGSQRAAIEAIKESTEIGEPGRPKGSPFLDVDAELMFAAESLEMDYRLLGRKPPKRRALIREAIAFSGRPADRLGKAAVARLAKRPNLAAILVEGIRLNRPDLMQHLPPDVDAQIKKIGSDPTRVNLAMILTGLLMLNAVAPKIAARFGLAVPMPIPETGTDALTFFFFLIRGATLSTHNN